MRPRQWLTSGLGLAAGAYAGYAAVTWLRYGRPASSTVPADRDALLDTFMPTYDVVDRHSLRVHAPASVTLAVASALDFFELPVVRAIFKARELILGATPDRRSRPHGLIDQARSLGWGVLADVTDREIVLGAATRPWDADVTFRAVSPQDFAAFQEPGLVKIVWTLRADPIRPDASIFHTETRAVATDADARRRFRRYWAAFSPGIVLIRLAMLRHIKHDAESHASAAIA